MRLTHYHIANTRFNNGFTLLELVLVMVLMGVVGAVVAPRLMVGQQFSDNLAADKLIGLLRQAQLRAMNDPQAVTENANLARCATVIINSVGFSIAQNCARALLDNSVIDQAARAGNFVGLRYPAKTVYRGAALRVQFGQPSPEANYLSEASLLGRPFINGEPITNTVTITLGNKQVKIEPEGYIHGS
ncbi:prepilin-type N-terminal cleavage/methylation domain-containing protein [Oceanisphaera avium]|uniref:MSHA biogenesis protein MshC n=1 Tax=Oceanisphaera avium TaxID=1903694 RepID=A0A1Y0CWH5_9GAMM|nr:prepilin-type N-terminal cleavage/methylation domain-containing protein [Oceanisphaera avium]ART79247.1 hypothetical protein CBP12_03040 [Oceanisphaera avium]